MNTAYWNMNEGKTGGAQFQQDGNYVAPDSDTTDVFFPDRTPG